MSARLYNLELDFPLLRKQKEWLLAQPTDGEELADGLVFLIDAIQDQAVDMGVPEVEVFGEKS
jgi:hypothetical protein